jgi:N-acetylmuramic acid 6-phosphate etherase
MVRLGKTYGNLMVDLRVTNAKLRDRAARIIERVTGAPRPDADAALEAASFDVKVAVMMLGGAATLEGATQRLNAHSGRLREALEASA